MSKLVHFFIGYLHVLAVAFHSLSSVDCLDLATIMRSFSAATTSSRPREEIFEILFAALDKEGVQFTVSILRESVNFGLQKWLL